MKKVLISDETLRTLARENVSLSFKEKLEIFKSLNELGVDFVEFPCVLGNKTEEMLIKTACALNGNSGIAVVSGNTEEEVEKSFALISGANNKKLIVSIPVSPVQMEYQLAKKPKAVLELLGTLVKKASSICENVEAELFDGTRAEPEFLAKAVETAINCGAKTVTVYDEQGVCLTEAVKKMISELYSAVPSLKDVNLFVRFSDAFSLGVSAIFDAIGSGADGVKLSASNLSDTPEFIKTVKALDEIGSKKGVSIGVNKTALIRIAGKVNDLLSKRESVFTASPEADEKLPENLTLESLSEILKKRGYVLDGDELKTVYKELQRISEKKAVNYKELDVVISNSILQVPPTYELVKFSVASSNVLPATASVVIKKAGTELYGLSFGNGSVDAAFLALESVLGRHFELDGFELGAVTEGKEAMAVAYVSLRNQGKIYSGRGVSTDIVGASIRAYINALNKIVYEEDNL